MENGNYAEVESVDPAKPNRPLNFMRFVQTSEQTEEVASLQRAVDFVSVTVIQVSIRSRSCVKLALPRSYSTSLPSWQDAIELLRLDDFYVDTFEAREGERKRKRRRWSESE